MECAEWRGGRRGTNKALNAALNHALAVAHSRQCGNPNASIANGNVRRQCAMALGRSVNGAFNSRAGAHVSSQKIGARVLPDGWISAY
jgi:hypothetical protein